MTNWQTTLAILAGLSVSMALAEDFQTINGKHYNDATIMRVEGDGIVIRTKTGISKIYFVELPKDVQEKFHYGQTTPIAKREPDPVKEPKQQARPQTNKGGRVVVVGQSAFSLKIIVAGIIVLIGVVAIFRSRFS